MATPLHDNIELRAGDAWEIDCSLVDPDNNPLDIGDASGLEWMLRDVNGLPCDAVVSGAELMLVRNQSPDTVIRLLVPATSSSTLNPGRYIDIFRVSMAGKPDSVAWGQILVAANGWEPQVVELEHNDWPLQSQLPRIDGRPRADGSKWARDNIVLVPCPYKLSYEGHPVRGIRINRKVALSLANVLDAIWEECGKSQNTIEKYGYHRFGGSFVVRSMRGGSSFSMHAYGRAIDFDPDNNQHRSTKHTFQNGDIIVRSFKAEGWVWGGDWSGRSVDAMHFQAARVR